MPKSKTTKKPVTITYVVAKLIKRMVERDVVMDHLQPWTTEVCKELTGSGLKDKKLAKVETIFLKRIDKLYQKALKDVYDFEKQAKAHEARAAREEDSNDAAAKD